MNDAKWIRKKGKITSILHTRMVPSSYTIYTVHTFIVFNKHINIYILCVLAFYWILYDPTELQITVLHKMHAFTQQEDNKMRNKIPTEVNIFISVFRSMNEVSVWAFSIKRKSKKFVLCVSTWKDTFIVYVDSCHLRCLHIL